MTYNIFSYHKIIVNLTHRAFKLHFLSSRAKLCEKPTIPQLFLPTNKPDLALVQYQAGKTPFLPNCFFATFFMNPICAGRNIMEEVELNDLLSRCRPQCFSECDTITSCFCHSAPPLCLDWCHNCAVRILLPPGPSPRTPKQTATTHGLSPRHNGAFFSHNAVAKVCKVTAADVTLRPGPLEGSELPISHRRLGAAGVPDTITHGGLGWM